jgi:hypothetical protein
MVRGVVVDRADGTPIGDVSVRVQDAGAPVKRGSTFGSAGGSTGARAASRCSSKC